MVTTNRGKSAVVIGRVVSLHVPFPPHTCGSGNIQKWQDKVITIVGIAFGFMLIPMILDSLNGQTVNLWSSSLTAIGLYVLSYCFFTLDLKLSSVSNLFVAVMWSIIFVLGVM